MADGSVEIRITGTVDPSVAASATQAKAAISGMSDATVVSAKAMANALKATGGNLKAISPEMLGLGTAAKSAASAQTGLAAATAVEGAAAEATTRTINSSRAAYESLALVHEALSGRFTRMAGTSTILAQALAGQGATTKAVSFLTSGLGLSILGTVAAIGLATAATISYENEEKKLTETALGMGAASGLTAQQLKQIGESADSASQSVRETTKAAEAFAAAGVGDVAVNRQLSNSVEATSQLMGVKFAEAQKTLAKAMEDPVKGAKELHDQLGILSGDQLEQIQILVAMGDKEQAQAIIMQALKERLDEARQAGVGVRGEFGQLIDVLSNVYNWIGSVTEGFGREAETLLEDLIPALHQAAQAHRDAAAAATQQAQNEAQLNKITGEGANLWAATPEGEAVKRRAELAGDVNKASDAYKVLKATLGDNAIATQRAKQTLEDYQHALSTYMTSAQQKIAADKLDVQIAAAKHAHNQQLVKDLTEQKALLSQAGIVESNADAKALAAGAGDVAGARTFAPKGRKTKGPDVVSEWEEQLHEQEVASNNYFADETATELAFWQSKLDLTKTGSKEWLDVQSKIYDASKTLAKRDYDEHIADLNDRIEADRGDFKKFQADWAEKLNFIKSKNGEESTAYRDAHRQMEQEERQHQDQMIREELTGNSKAISALKTHLQAELQLRQTNASAAEAIIRQQAEGSLSGEISAAARIGQLHLQLAQQEIADAEAVHAKEEQLLQQGVDDALRAYGADDQRYKQALADKAAADQQYYDKKRALEAKAYQQQIADIQSLRQAYHSYIDGVTSSGVSAFTGLLAGTETWQQATSSIFNSLLSTIDQILSRMVENWIVNILVGKGQQDAANTASVLSYAAVAGAAGTASFAAAPWPIDLGAPAFGASMEAAALAYLPQASLATGTNYLPSDMVVQAHQGERVIPRADNSKLIQLVEMAAGAASAGGSAAANDTGDVHLHFHGFSDPSSMNRWARSNRQMFGEGMKQFARMGGSSSIYRR